ncbi:MAG: zinc ribbon domain-containing protein [Terriglobales bacterium]|jgi:RNA polymerase subunit RPABC4/transcription elongation factor Spt4
MTNGNHTSTRFKDEISIISRWAYFVAILVFLAMEVLLVVVVGRDHDAPPLALRCLLGAVAGALFGFFILLIGYVNRDAGRRGMGRLLWTLIAIFVPNGLGIVLYFILRKPRTANCPQCHAVVEPGFSFCPRCRSRLRPVCPHCQRSIDPGDKFCPYCGGGMETTAGVPSAPAPSQP